jgi:outer membrane protein assembly factor BamE (lipoprotein component of BamABCDE complex)
MICLLGFVFYQERTVTPQDLSGIKLSMNKDEILYIMGDPLRSYASADDSYISIDKSNESNNTSFTKNNNSWQYARKGHEINIVFDKVTQKIDKIRCS